MAGNFRSGEAEELVDDKPERRRQAENRLSGTEKRFSAPGPR